MPKRTIRLGRSGANNFRIAFRSSSSKRTGTRCVHTKQGRSCLNAKYVSAYQNFLPLILFFSIWRFIIQEKWKIHIDEVKRQYWQF